jgi:mannitol/fructose-specific phosphotransferase system IIA component (Ntr-type)
MNICLNWLNAYKCKLLNFFTIIFRTSLQPYLRLATTGLTRNTMIKHKEIIIICEENGPIITNYNALIIRPKSKLVAQPIVTYTTTKQQLTCSSCDKIGHAKKKIIIGREKNQ